MSMTSDFLTVATVDYTPQAVATFRSARQTGNYASFNYFVLDATVETVVRLRGILKEDGGWINVFGPYDIGVEREVFLSAFRYYDAFELSCFAKYVGIAHVLRSPNASDNCVFSD